MILTCPNCGTQYVVKDGAIPPQGRQVRCASCKHSWHQDPEPGEAPPPHSEPVEEADAAYPQDVQDEENFASVGEPPEEAQQDETIAEATLIEPRSGPEAEERAYEAAMAADPGPPDDAAPPAQDETAVEPPPPPPPRHADEGPAELPAATGDWRAPPGEEAQDDDFSPYAAEDEAEPRRRSPLLKLFLIALLVAAVAIAFWFLAPPEWKARIGLGGAVASPLALVTTHMDRQRLASGNELLTVTGRVINPTSESQQVPPLQAQLKTRTGQVVYSWTIAPPARSLAPGASASFNSAEVNVPPGGDELTITLGSPQA